VSHHDLAIYIKVIFRQKKNYGNSNTSPYKYMTFEKSSKRNQNPSTYYNIITHLKFQHKPKYQISKNPHIKIDIYLGVKLPLSYNTL